MRKALAIVLAVALTLGMVACTKNNATEEHEESSEADMTPSTTKEELEQKVDFENADPVTAEDGEVTISSGGHATIEEADVALAARTTLTPDEVWAELDPGATSNYSGSSNFTMPEAVLMSNGSLGTLSIPKINLSVSVYETEDEMEDMVHGVAHFKETSCWDGNIGLAGHNQGVNTFFGQLHTLAAGDTITYETALGTRTYQVTTSIEIGEDDWSTLGRTDANQITLITCVNHDLSKRLCVQAIEVA